MYLSDEDAARLYGDTKRTAGGVELARVAVTDADGHPVEAWGGVLYAPIDEGGNKLRDIYITLTVNAEGEGARYLYRADVEGLGTAGECAAFAALLGSVTSQLLGLGFTPSQLSAFAGRVVDRLIDKGVAR